MDQTKSHLLWCSWANTAIPKKSKLKLIQQDELWIEIDDYLQLNEFISFETMLTFLGYDLPEAKQITKQLQHDANQHLFKLKFSLTIFYLE